ncbi:hypothetical protein [Vagococcus carniphilus]|uniref:Uncharacterized protein n=1 Tax=Vagococcus carniphilus TaxID=218144 RepID=A0A430B1I8_9ENTE|nr:hypothetical protein [Vagococcus carniphilus]QNN74058.1 hypothetical protein H9L18_05600 [Vagococcus carniphilus]RSU14159.1 hypothetical protein CBF28_08375 [Vagococcus carniphilus]
MFNNWLKRRDDDSKENENELEKNELAPTSEDVVPSSNLDYDSGSQNNDDDYYYYYYYEAGDNNGPTIPNLDLEKKEETLDFYDSKEEAYVSPFDSINSDERELNQEQVVDDFSYEQDYVQASSSNESLLSDQSTLLENENTQLREKIDQLLAENDQLQDQASRVEKVEEANEKLSSKIDEYGSLLEENNNLQIKLLDFEKLKETHDMMVDSLEQLNTNISDKDQTIEKLNTQLTSLTENADKESGMQEENFKELEANLAKLSNEKEALEDSIKVLNEKHQSEVDALKQQVSEAEEKMNELTKKMDEKLSVESSKVTQLVAENDSYIKEIESLQQVIEELRAKPSVESVEAEEIKRTIKELEEQLSHSKQLETQLAKRYEEELEKNQNKDLEMKKKEQELTEMNEKLSQTEQLEKELAELRDNQKVISELQNELSNMRHQQQEVTSSLTELTSEKTRAARLEQEVMELRSNQNPDVSDIQNELLRVKEELRLANLRADQNGSMNQSDIAHVMLEAQAKARQIVDVANYEAKRRVADSEMELSAVSQEARNYYRKLEKIKSESEVVFSELLRKLESIGDIDRL